MRLNGRCHCGYLSFEAEADPAQVAICHCTDCQTSTGSAFRVNIPAPAASFKMLSGQPTAYVKTTAESGNPRVQAFCPKCGTPMVLRTAKNGAQPGRKFYGCANYPKCRVILPFEEG